MVQKIAITLGAGGLILLGGLTAAAQELHTSPVSTIAVATPKGEAHGDSVSAAATAQAKKIDVEKGEVADTDTDKTDADKTGAESNDSTNTGNAHGKAVSAVAKSDCTAAHTSGQQPNHGGCVSAAAKANP